MDGTSQHLPDSSQTGKPRLLLLTHEYPRLTGDTAFLTEEVKALAERFQVTLVPLTPSDAPLGPVPEGVQVIQGYRPPARSQILPHYLHALRAPEVKAEIADAQDEPGSADLGRIPREARYRWACAQCMAAQLSKLLADADCQDFDLLYSFWMHTEALALLELAKAQERRTGRRPLVVSRTHGYELYNERSPFGRQLFKSLEARSLDGAYFACKAAGDYFNTHWGLDQVDSGIFYLGTHSEEQAIEPKAASASPATLTLVSCSNSIPIKRIDTIIRALALLGDLEPGLTLDWHHIGDGESQVSLEHMAQDLLGSKDKVTWTFHGYVANDRLKDLYRSLEPDLFITTSSTEGGVPVSIQEAFSLGIPAIGTAVGGIPEIIQDGQTGFLLDADAHVGTNTGQLARSLAQAIQRFASLSPAERQSLSSNALSLQRQTFDSQANAAAFAQHLRDLAGSQPEGGR